MTPRKIIIQDGHKQSAFEANLEALGQALVLGVERQRHCSAEEMLTPRPRSRSRGRAEPGMGSVTPVRADSPLPPHLRTPPARTSQSPRTTQEFPCSASRDLGLLGSRRGSSLSSGREEAVPCTLANHSQSQRSTTSSANWEQLQGLEGWTPRTAREAATPLSRASRPIPDEFSTSGKDAHGAWCRGVCCGYSVCSPTQTIMIDGNSPNQEQGTLLPVLCIADCCKNAPRAGQDDDELHDAVAKEAAELPMPNNRSEVGNRSAFGGPRTVRVHRHGAQGGA